MRSWRNAFFVDAAGIITPFSPDASLPFPWGNRGLLGSLGLERFLADEFNARDDEWKFVMIITGGLELVRGIPFAV